MLAQEEEAGSKAMYCRNGNTPRAFEHACNKHHKQ